MIDVVAERRDQVFPKLSDAQLRRIARYGERRHALAGEMLFDQGTSGLDIHVVLSGAVEIVRPGIRGDELITVHDAGEFTGEVSVLAGTSSKIENYLGVNGHLGPGARGASARTRWPAARAPLLFKTNRHRVFAVGDVRSGVKRVASAVGEGSVCVQLVHRALAE
jgi:CRP-like cAMP-binding protein